VTAFAIGAEVRPGSLVLDGLGVEVLLLLADVARKAVLVPQLVFDLAALVLIADVEVMEPLLAENIPTGGRTTIRPSGSVVR
jgi:hypothetical protein